jgi:hypothetical protein
MPINRTPALLAVLKAELARLAHVCAVVHFSLPRAAIRSAIKLAIFGARFGRSASPVPMPSSGITTSPPSSANVQCAQRLQGWRDEHRHCPNPHSRNTRIAQRSEPIWLGCRGGAAGSGDLFGSIGAIDQAEAIFDAVKAIINSIESCIEPREFGADMRQYGSPQCDAGAVR